MKPKTSCHVDTLLLAGNIHTYRHYDALVSYSHEFLSAKISGYSYEFFIYKSIRLNQVLMKS